jgi:Phosphoinositide phospholipase C, Ca2+-dependent
MPFARRASRCLLILWLGPPTLTMGFGSSNDAVKMNQIQVIGTHNSYHAGLAPSEAQLMQQMNPKLYQALDYRHRPLDLQLSSGVRQIELDIFADSEGGRYAHPSAPDAVAAAGLEKDPDFDPQGLMSKPGFKVMHVQDIDAALASRWLPASKSFASGRGRIRIICRSTFFSRPSRPIFRRNTTRRAPKNIPVPHSMPWTPRFAGFFRRMR